MVSSPDHADLAHIAVVDSVPHCRTDLSLLCHSIHGIERNLDRYQGGSNLRGKPSLSPETATALLSILFAEVVGAALLQVAMLYFWFGFDNSSWLRRAFWFLLLCFVLPFFWALYYFLVCRRQVRDRLEKSTPAFCDS